MKHDDLLQMYTEQLLLYVCRVHFTPRTSYENDAQSPCACHLEHDDKLENASWIMGKMSALRVFGGKLTSVMAIVEDSDSVTRRRSALTSERTVVQTFKDQWYRKKLSVGTMEVSMSKCVGKRTTRESAGRTRENRRGHVFLPRGCGHLDFSLEEGNRAEGGFSRTVEPRFFRVRKSDRRRLEAEIREIGH